MAYDSGSEEEYDDYNSGSDVEESNRLVSRPVWSGLVDLPPLQVGDNLVVNSPFFMRQLPHRS
jgi:hypothetical protein